MSYHLIENLKGEAADFVQAYLESRPFQSLAWYAIVDTTQGDACLHVLIFDECKIVESRDFPLPESSPLLPPLPTALDYKAARLQVKTSRAAAVRTRS